ncbi:MAG: DNA-3-methyladenine glycosylase [Candidatus Saccharimonadales bacterium]
MKRLTPTPSFLSESAEIAAPQLLGWQLLYDDGITRTAGYITEVEAYTMDDPASHSYRPMTSRTAPMFAEAGTVYVYFTYGKHYCLNIVTGPRGRGEAILIRAIQPTLGIEIMQQRRQHSNTNYRELTNGPGKLTQAMGITTSISGSGLGKQLFITAGQIPDKITSTPRIGIRRAVDRQWRFVAILAPSSANNVNT